MKILSGWRSVLGIMLFAGDIAHGQVSCSDYGQAIYCSNGLSAVRSGNTLYFSDGVTAQTSGNTVTISGQPVEVSRSNAAANYAAGQAIGSLVGGVIADVRQRRKFERLCDVDPYAHGRLNGMLAFCSQTAILDACSNAPQFDFSGFKYAGDTPHHLSWNSEGTLWYLPGWPRSDDTVKCVPDVAAHSTHEAKLWLAYKHETEYWLRDLHPHLSQDDCARIVNYIYAHPEAYQAGKVTSRMFEKIYVAVKASS